GWRRRSWRRAALPGPLVERAAWSLALGTHDVNGPLSDLREDISDAPLQPALFTVELRLGERAILVHKAAQQCLLRCLWRLPWWWLGRLRLHWPWCGWCGLWGRCDGGGRCSWLWRGAWRWETHREWPIGKDLAIALLAGERARVGDTTRLERAILVHGG